MPVHVGPGGASDTGWIDGDDALRLRLDLLPDIWSDTGDPADAIPWFEDVRFGPAEACPTPEPA
ncbi:MULTISPECIES: hypothetical protein [Inquilinus]|uniref:Uncharacterized protein n=1 Tax=Inquilinus ginsengisoli TaxID=363840 RepID=A0ABU1JHX9_9PROT|nr:hypothetical protein [Inquilinus ginsengisoli]MDR6287669.1 hypothetical protein [Inquilinus ginsengisoli]